MKKRKPGRPKKLGRPKGSKTKTTSLGRVIAAQQRKPRRKATGPSTATLLVQREKIDAQLLARNPGYKAPPLGEAYRIHHDEKWRKADGTMIEVQDMTPDHIRNVLRMVIRKARQQQLLRIAQLAAQAGLDAVTHTDRAATEDGPGADNWTDFSMFDQ